MPHACAEVQNACLRGDFVKALELHDALVPLHDVMFIEASPGPVKYAASLMGRSTPDLRLPLVETTETTRERVRAAMKRVKLI